ncbi:hypothetical protein [Actinomadura violacea]|uniref:Uncharacterized protein n=1 Tax=Actinomadura violacea TaxID=2819934 RepID=A0ABS3RZ31_9ACTN|nr:hypothetical protein [Actinomadura violacea]MBO2461718.1 hypothetical protein [Actinomadura violacea]
MSATAAARRLPTAAAPLQNRARRLRNALLWDRRPAAVVLRDLAERVIEDPEAYDKAWRKAARRVSPYLPKNVRREAFDDFCDQVEREQDIERGELPWYEIAPDLACSDPDTAAAEMQRVMVSDALDRLLYGDR